MVTGGNGIVEVGMIEKLSIGLKGRRIFPVFDDQLAEALKGKQRGGEIVPCSLVVPICPWKPIA